MFGKLARLTLESLEGCGDDRPTGPAEVQGPMSWRARAARSEHHALLLSLAPLGYGTLTRQLGRRTAGLHDGAAAANVAPDPPEDRLTGTSWSRCQPAAAHAARPDRA